MPPHTIRYNTFKQLQINNKYTFCALHIMRHQHAVVLGLQLQYEDLALVLKTICPYMLHTWCCGDWMAVYIRVLHVFVLHVSPYNMYYVYLTAEFRAFECIAVYYGG